MQARFLRAALHPGLWRGGLVGVWEEKALDRLGSPEGERRCSEHKGHEQGAACMAGLPLGKS